MGVSIIVSSGKGGVGKTNVVVNLGVALSRLGEKVVVVDGSLTTADISLHLGIPLDAMSLSHVLKGRSTLEAATYACKHTSKHYLDVIPGSVHMDTLKEFEGRKFSNLLKKLKKEYDFVLVDCAAGLGREAVSAIKSCDKMLVVANPELPSVVNSSKLIKIAKRSKVKPIGVILNRVGRFRQELKEGDIEPLLDGIPIIGSIPEDKKVAIAVRKSEAVINYCHNCGVSKELRNIARSLI